MCVGIEVDVGIELVDHVVVVVVCEVEAQSEVFCAHSLIEQGHLDTTVGGLSHVLVLVAVTGSLVDRHLHEDVFCGVPVEVEAATEFAVPHTEVETEVS